MYAQALEAIAGEHRRKPFTSLHAFWADEPGWVAALAGRWLGIPTIISLAGGELVRMPEIRYGMALRPGRRALIRWGLDRAQCIGVGSDYLMRIARSELGPRNQSKLKHIPLGVDTQLFSPQAPGHRSGDSPPKVLNVGSLTFVKGQRDLIESMDRRAESQLQIAGTGPLEAQLRARTAALELGANVSFLGEIAHERMPDVYQACRVLVQSSKHEAQGMAVLEAAACGIPVFGTGVGVLPELGIEAQMGPALTDQLNQLLEDGVGLRQYSESAHQKIMERYSLEVCMQRFMDLYQEMSR